MVIGKTMNRTAKGLSKLKKKVPVVLTRKAKFVPLKSSKGRRAGKKIKPLNIKRK